MKEEKPSKSPSSEDNQTKQHSQNQVSSGHFQPSPPRNEGKLWLAVLLAAIVGAIIGGLIASFLVPYLAGLNPLDMLQGKYTSKSPSQVERVIVPQGGGKTTYSSSIISAVAKKVQPSVVNIRIKKLVSESLLGDIEEKGEGSGVIYRADGYILTNNHVIQDAREIWVTIGNEPDVKGKVVGKDKETDLAVVKVDKKNLPAAELGRAAKLEVGQLTVAIGSPFGFEHTVTAGIVSALHRDVTAADETGEPTTYTDLIQTDAAINPGNSGGALANEKGQVIGINALVASTSGGYEGVSFAIPIELAKSVAEQLIAKGEVSHPYMGVSLMSVDEDFAKQHELATSQGALVVKLAKDSPADKAGIQVGDVIVAFNDKEIETSEDLIAELRKGKVGDKVRVTYFRGSEKKTVELSLVEKPKKFSL